MDDLDGGWSQPVSPLQAAAALNASWPEAAGLGLSPRTQLVLEILMVMMCFGAVTGTETVDILSMC